MISNCGWPLSHRRPRCARALECEIVMSSTACPAKDWNLAIRIVTLIQTKPQLPRRLFWWELKYLPHELGRPCSKGDAQFHQRPTGSPQQNCETEVVAPSLGDLLSVWGPHQNCLVTNAHGYCVTTRASRERLPVYAPYTFWNSSKENVFF